MKLFHRQHGHTVVQLIVCLQHLAPLADLLLRLGDGLLPLDHPRPLGDVAATDQDGGKAGANLFHQNRLTPTLTTVLCLSSSFLSSAALLTPVTKGDIGLLDLKLKLSKERDKLDLGFRTGVNIGVLFSDRSWMLKLKILKSVDKAGDTSVIDHFFQSFK